MSNQVNNLYHPSHDVPCSFVQMKFVETEKSMTTSSFVILSHCESLFSRLLLNNEHVLVTNQ